MTTWRLLITSPASGAWNMAVDEAIATLSARGDSPPTLRFYRWRPPAVSLGRHQPVEDIDSARLQERGWDIVRRPTGGRAILHIDELTYSIAGAATEPRLQGPVLDVYNLISRGLLLGLRRLGVSAGKAPADKRAGQDVSAACFEVPSAYEISVGNQKLIGSAQRRAGSYVLQHGSLPLHGDITRLVDVMVFGDDARAEGEPVIDDQLTVEMRGIVGEACFGDRYETDKDINEGNRISEEEILRLINPPRS